MGQFRDTFKRFIPEPYKPLLKVFIDRPVFVQRMLAGQELDIGELENRISPADGPVIDVGAEKGEVSYHFAKKGFSVFAFEPSFGNFLSFVAFCFRYICMRRIHVFKMACSDADGMSTLETMGPSYGYKLSSESGTGPVRSEHVVTIQLGKWVKSKKLTAVSFLKVDAEGSDLKVLRGYFEEKGVPRPQVVMFEFSKHNLPPLLDYMKSQGYPYFRFVCRVSERPGQSAQLGLYIIDGMHPLLHEAQWGNGLCSLRPFRLDQLPPEEYDKIRQRWADPEEYERSRPPVTP